MADPDEVPMLRACARPMGWLGAAAAVLVGLPLWFIATLLMLLDRFRNGPVKIKDRSSLQLPTPFPGLIYFDIEASNGIRLSAVSPGRKPSKPLMLLVHGFPEFWYSWRHLMQAFKEDYDVVAINNRGYDTSDKPPGPDSYSLDKLTADVAAAVKALGHDSCILVAHDWGGAVSWLVAAQYPGLVKRLVILAAPHFGLAQYNMWRLRVSSLVQIPIVPEWLLSRADFNALDEAFTQKGVGMCSGTMSTTDREWFKQSFARPGVLTCSVDWYRALVRHATLWPAPGMWEAARRRMRMPVLVLMGDKDLYIRPVLMEGLEQVAPESEMHVLEQCSHWIQQDRPEVVCSLMRSFLAKHPLN